MKGYLQAPAVACLLLSLLAPGPLWAGSFQEIVDLTDAPPSPVPGEIIVQLVPLRIDPRCLPWTFRINDTLDPIPNPLGDDFLTVARARAELQAAADRWNAIPTSYVDLQIAGTVSNPFSRRFDQINEITFRTSPFEFFPVPASNILSRDSEPIAVARAIRVLEDGFMPAGTDFDGDGDTDVAAIPACQDVDHDGDIEFPESFYPAGSVFDVDIVFNTGVSSGPSPLTGFRFTVDPATADTDPRSVDLMAVAVQAFGIGQGLTHVLTSQHSATDGRDGTMFPRIDTSDPAAELAFRTLDVDSVATSSLLFPEGTASEGPAALEPGDVPFWSAFGVITGEIRHGGRDERLAGASVFAIDAATGRVVSTAISGISQFSVTPDAVNATFLDAAFHVHEGRYTIPVPPGQYVVGVEATDGGPAASTSFNLESILGGILGQNDFDEDFYNGAGEAVVEGRPGVRVVVPVRAGETVGGIDIITNRTRQIANFGPFDHTGVDGAGPGAYYAVRIPGEQFLQADAALGGDAILQGAAFFTVPEDASVVPVFAEALLAAGNVLPDGTARIDLDHPLARQRPFIAQDWDFSPFWFDNGGGLAERVRAGLAHGAIESLFLVLRVPDGPFPGASGEPPKIGLDVGTASFGLSFSSADGAVFSPAASSNYMFKLVLSERPAPR